MKVLAIDTSTMLGGIAIMDDLLGLVVETRLNVKSTHSERLMTTIDYALNNPDIRYPTWTFSLSQQALALSQD